MKIFDKRFFLFCLLYVASIYAVDIAITIDDYPLPNSRLFTVKERTHLFIKACDQFKCKIAFFCVGQHYIDRNDNSLFKLLKEHGHFIANHSMTHPHVSSLTLDAFETEIMLTEGLLSSYDNMRRWFRYPYLDYGNQVALGGSHHKFMSFVDALDELGYKDGYVTINTYDWHINKRLLEAIKQQKQIDYDALGTLYVSLLEQWIEHYSKSYENAFNRSITQTLLFHDNDLNALYLSDILSMIQNRGWHIVSPELAFQDSSWRKDADKVKLASVQHALHTMNSIDQLLVSHGVIG